MGKNKSHLLSEKPKSIEFEDINQTTQGKVANRMAGIMQNVVMKPN